MQHPRSRDTGTFPYLAVPRRYTLVLQVLDNGLPFIVSTEGGDECSFDMGKLRQQR